MPRYENIVYQHKNISQQISGNISGEHLTSEDNLPALVLTHLGVLTEQSRDSHGITIMVSADKLDNEIMTQIRE